MSDLDSDNSGWWSRAKLDISALDLRGQATTKLPTELNGVQGVSVWARVVPSVCGKHTGKALRNASRAGGLEPRTGLAVRCTPRGVRVASSVTAKRCWGTRRPVPFA